MRTVFNRFALEVNIDFMHAFASENGYGFWMKLFFFYLSLANKNVSGKKFWSFLEYNPRGRGGRGELHVDTG